MNNSFIENLKHHDINIFKFIMVGNNTLGCAIVSTLQRDVGGENYGDVSIQVEAGGELVDLDKYKKSDSEYHIEINGAVMDIIISQDEINVGFSYQEESTIQTLKIRE